MSDPVCICDKCKKEVTEKTVVKKPLGKNFHIFDVGLGLKIWTPEGSDEQWGLFCPHCNTLHAFGFNRKEK
jgi:hypothetical protein